MLRSKRETANTVKAYRRAMRTDAKHRAFTREDWHKSLITYRTRKAQHAS